MTFAELLKAQREAAGLTQKELAEKAGITQGVVTNYELAKREPTWAAVQKLADALGVSVTTFRESDDAEADPPPALKKPKPKKSNK